MALLHLEDAFISNRKYLLSCIRVQCGQARKTAKGWQYTAVFPKIEAGQA